MTSLPKESVSAFVDFLPFIFLNPLYNCKLFPICKNNVFPLWGKGMAEDQTETLSASIS